MITIDVQNRTIHKNGKEITMKSKLLLNMLLYLTNSKGAVRTRQNIIDKCWDSKVITARNIDIRICELRKIIDDPAPGEVVIGVKGVGYKINPDEIRLVNQGGTKNSQYDGYVFVKDAKLKGELVVVLQNIKDVDDWIVISKSEYE